MEYRILHDDLTGPTVYWCIGSHIQEPECIVPIIKKLAPGVKFRLVGVKADDWNADFSPWAAPALFGKEDFKGRGCDTLQWIERECRAAVEAERVSTKSYVAGFSLAGLFAIWAKLESSWLDGAACCSGSLWYPGWIDFVKAYKAERPMDIYLSLGDKEHLAKNPMISSVVECYRTTYETLSERLSAAFPASKVIFELNPGAHFTDSLERTAKGIAALCKM